MQLREQIETLSGREGSEYSSADRELFQEFKRALTTARFALPKRSMAVCGRLTRG